MTLDVHGDMRITQDQRIIRIEATGPWNIEFFTKLHQELAVVAHNMSNLPYGTLLIPIGETLAVSEALDYHIHFLKQTKSTAVAIVLNQSHVSLTTQAMCQQVYQQAGLTHKFFSSETQALDWLNKQIDQVIVMGAE